MDVVCGPAAGTHDDTKAREIFDPRATVPRTRSEIVGATI